MDNRQRNENIRVTSFERYKSYAVISKLLTIVLVVKIKLILPVLVFSDAAHKQYNPKGCLHLYESCSIIYTDLTGNYMTTIVDN